MAIKPGFAVAHCNLGSALRKQGNLDAALAQFQESLATAPQYAKAHKGIGMTRHYQGRLTEAKQAYQAGIAIDPVPSLAHVGLRRILADLKERPLPDCSLPDNQREFHAGHPGLRVWNRFAGKELIETIYGLAVISPEAETNSGLEKDKYSSGIREGNVRFSENFRLFALDDPVIRKLRDDIVASVSALLDADVFVVDSFFNIYHAGSRVNRHNHIQDVDKDLGFAAQKYSMVYYVDAGDKTAAEPGILTLHDPDFAVDPQDGDILLFPSASDHSTSYSGATDRVIVGVNFYVF